MPLHLTEAPSLPRWRALLEARWQARLQQLTELSLAYHDAAAYAGARPGDHAAARRQRPSAVGWPMSRRRSPGWRPAVSAGASNAAPPSRLPGSGSPRRRGTARPATPPG
jgi:hypothetical protein